MQLAEPDPSRERAGSRGIPRRRGEPKLISGARRRCKEEGPTQAVIRSPSSRTVPLLDQLRPV